MIKIENAKKTYGKLDIFSDVNLEFKNGEIYKLSGTNGSGKTVLLKSIAGYSVLDNGSITVDGKKIRNKNNFIEDAGILIEEPSFIKDETLISNLEAIKQFCKNKKEINLENWLDFYDLQKHKNKKFKHLSLGTKKKMLLIQAFMHEPKILLLDEPFNALDKESIKKTQDLLRKYKDEGRLIIIATHTEDKKDIYTKFIEIEEGVVKEV